jgi:hypothetical protein
LDPQDKGIQKELLFLKSKSKQQEKKQQKFYANMFDKISKDEDSLYKNKPQTEKTESDGDGKPEEFKSDEFEEK